MAFMSRANVVIPWTSWWMYLGFSSIENYLRCYFENWIDFEKRFEHCYFLSRHQRFIAQAVVKATEYIYQRVCCDAQTVARLRLPVRFLRLTANEGRAKGRNRLAANALGLVGARPAL